MIYRLTVFEADDVTEWLSVSTDPLDANPWMMVPDQWAESEINFVSGSGSIGEIVVEVLDPQTGGTQAQRGLTAKLADSNGRSAMSGRRALVEDSEDGYGFRTIFDGVINRVELSDSLSSFFISIRDIRERERDVELFRFTETCSVLPQGVLNGYGIPYDGAPTTEWLVPPTAPLTGVFRLNPSQIFGEGFVDLSEYVIGNTSDGVPVVRAEVIMSDAAVAASASTGDAPRIRVLWRTEGSTGSYTTVNVGSFVQAAGTFVETIGAWVGSEDGRPVNAASRIAMPNGFGLSNTLPSNGARVEVIVQYIGETSEQWPLHIEGVTAGELIRDIYNGDYSDEDPKVRYDETSLLALTTPVRARVTSVVTDAREWVERNLYVAAGAAPAIIDGKVYAVTYELPDVTVDVTELGNAEADVMPGWSQTTDDAVNVVEVTYPRDRSIAPDEPGYESAPGDRIVARDVLAIVPKIIPPLGQKLASFRVEVLRAIGGPQGQPYSGDVADETGRQVALRIGDMLTDRFALGGQTFMVRADRKLSDVEDLKVGDWVVVTTPWTPDYQTGQRGGNRLGQIIARRDESPIRCELVIIDAGPDNQPLVMPTLGTLSQTGLGEVVVPIATAPSGAEARVDYAVSTTQPAAGSSLWTFAGRSAASGSVSTPQLPSGKLVWIRARSEAPGRRPSGYTTPVSVTVTAVPRLRKVFGYVTDAGVEIHWRANPTTAGVRIEYVQHLFGEEPDFDYADVVDTGTSPELLTDAFDRSPNQVLSFRVTPYPVFSGGAVSGTPGQPLQSSVFLGLPDAVPFGYVVAFKQDEQLEFVAQGNQLAAGGEWAVRLGQPPEEPDDPLAELTGSFQGPFTLEQLSLYSDPYEDDVWVGVWFYDDFDSEPSGVRGPRVLAKAIDQPLPGTLQPDLVVRVEYDEASDDPIARVIATVTDPFLRARPVDPMTAYVDTGPIDFIPELTDPAWIAQPIETSGPYAGSYVWEVVLTEKHLSVAALAFYWLDADGTERVINQVLWLDIGDDANIVNINVSYDDRTATVTVKGDADTDELYAEESDDGDPDGTWYPVDSPTPAFTGDRFATSRRGTFSVQTRIDRERFFRVQGRNFDGRFGPFEFFQVDKASDVVDQPVKITSLTWAPDTGESGGTTITDPAGGANRVAVWAATFSSTVRSYRIIVGPFSSPSGSPVEANYYTTFTGPGLRTDFIRNLFTTGELTTELALQFPGSYDVNTTFQIIAYASTDATGTAIGDDSALLLNDDPLNLGYFIDGSTVVEGQALRAGSNVSIALVNNLPEISLDTSSLSIDLGDVKGVGTQDAGGPIVVASASGANTIVQPSGVGQVLKSVTAGPSATYEWGTVTTGVTSISAGDALSGGGTGSVTLDVNPYVGFAAGYGQTEIVSDSLAVVLGTDSANKAAPGVHSHTVNQITDATTVGQNLVKLSNPSAITFLRVNANNSVTAQSAANFRTDIGLGTGDAPTFNGLTANGAVGIQAAASTFEATHVPIFITNPASTTVNILSRSVADFRTDIGAGTGTVTSVGSGNGLSGGPITTSGSLTVNEYDGTASNRGRTALTAITGGQALAVVLGTGANEAMPGNTPIPQGTVTSVSGGDGLTGTVTSSGSINMGTPSKVSATSTNSTTSTSHTHELDGAIADVTVSTDPPGISDTPARAGSLWFVI